MKNLQNAGRKVNPRERDFEAQFWRSLLVLLTRGRRDGIWGPGRGQNN